VLLRLALLSTCVASLGGPRAFAQDDTHEPPPEALQFFESGRAHYEAGRYQEAAVDMERALQLDPGSTTLIFNLARIYELLGDLEKAIEFGEKYLELLPDDMVDERERAETTLRRVRGAQEWLALRQAEQPPELRQLTPTVIVRERGVADSAFWATLASGAGLLAVGGALGGVALAKRNEAHDLIIRDESDRNEQNDVMDRADRLALTADIFLAAGLATEIGALLLYLLRVRTFEREVDEDEGASARLQLGPGAATLILEGRF
jgi:tetratricopeptide (TPR) repeat protein